MPIAIYNGALDFVADFFLSKAKNEDLAALGRGFLTHEKVKSTVIYVTVYIAFGINPHVGLNTYFE